MFQIPEWTYEFHGHKCPFMPIGYRMGALAMQKLAATRALNHEMFIFSEMGIGHPQGCMQDGLQSVTSATFGKGQMHKLFYGKIAATFYYKGKGAVRLALKGDFVDKLAPHEFFKFRKKGVEPSDIPQNVSDDIIRMVLNATDDELFSVKMLPDFKFIPVSGSFNKTKCAVCGEYVFDHYLRKADDLNICIPCSGYGHDENLVYLPLK